MVLRHPNCPELDGVLCWEKIQGQERHAGAPALPPGHVRAGGQLALALAMLWEWVWKAWAETPQDGVRKGKEMAAGTFSLLSCTLFAPKGYSFLHLQNIFLKWETT